MKRKLTYTTGEYEIEFSGNFCAGYPARGPSYSSGGEPGEPDSMEDIYVGVIIKGTAIDITDKLNEKQLAHFEELLLDEVKQEKADAYDDYVNRMIDQRKKERE